MKLQSLIFYTDTPIYGGAERAMLMLAKNLPKDRYRITLVCSSYLSLESWRKEWEKNEFEVISVDVAHKHDPRHFVQLRKILLQKRPDVLHVHLWNPGSCRYAFLAFNSVKKKLPSLRLVTTEHDPFPLTGLKKKFKQWCLGLTNHTITVSNDNRHLLEQLYPEIKGEITTIYNGIDVEEWKHKLSKVSFAEHDNTRRDNLKSVTDETVFLTIAALHPRKGLIYLIEAFAKVIKKYPKVKLVIIGEGPQKDELQELIKNLKLDHNIVLQGYCENVESYLLRSDIFVLSSIKEAFGLVLLEAMVAGLPLIATAVGGIPEIVTSERNGLLVPAKDSEALAQAMMWLLDHPHKKQEMSMYNKEDVKKFSVQQMALKTAQLYEKILNNS